MEEESERIRQAAQKAPAFDDYDRKKAEELAGRAAAKDAPVLLPAEEPLQAEAISVAKSSLPPITLPDIAMTREDYAVGGVLIGASWLFDWWFARATEIAGMHLAWFTAAGLVGVAAFRYCMSGSLRPPPPEIATQNAVYLSEKDEKTKLRKIGLFSLASGGVLAAVIGLLHVFKAIDLQPEYWNPSLALGMAGLLIVQWDKFLETKSTLARAAFLAQAVACAAVAWRLF